MGLDHKIIIFWWSCDPFLQDHQNKWSHGHDLVFFMISWFWSWRFHDLLPQNPWSCDPTHGISMIRWSHSPKFHDPLISLSEIQPLDLVISLTETKIPWSGDVKLVLDPKVKWRRKKVNRTNKAAQGAGPLGGFIGFSAHCSRDPIGFWSYWYPRSYWFLILLVSNFSKFLNP